MKPQSIWLGQGMSNFNLYGGAGGVKPQLNIGADVSMLTYLLVWDSSQLFTSAY